MVPLEPNKVTPESDSNDHSDEGMSTIMQYFPPQPSKQQQADLEDKPHLEQDVENLSGDGQKQTEHQETPRSYRVAGQQNQRRGLSLRSKATALAIALGTLPVLAIGATAYYFADQAIVKQINTVKQSASIGLADKTNRFMFERYGDIQVLSNLRSFNDPTVREITSPQQQEAQLNNFVKVYGFYDSIAVLDLNGNLIAQSSGKASKNHKARNYFQQVIKTDKPFIDDPETSKSTGKQVIHIAAPIKDTATGKTIAVVRTQMPIERMAPVLANFSTGGDEYHLISLSNNQVFEATEKTQIGRNALSDFGSGLGQLEKQEKGTLIVTNKIDNAQQLIAYSPLEKIEGLPELNWGAMIATNTKDAFAPQKQLLLTLILGTGLTALLVSAIAAYLADRATRPILAASDAVDKLGQGKLDTRIPVQGKDELATLGSNINLMANQLQNRERALLKNKEAQTEQARLFTNIGFLRVQDSQDLDSVFSKALKGARKILNADRVVIYRFNSDWSGYIAAESVNSGLPTALADKIEDPCIPEELIKAYRKGRVVPTNNVFEAGFHPDHLKLMERLQIKANLVTPILKDNQLFGLLIAHHCSEPHAWEQSEINFLRQLGSQVGAILDRVAFLEQQKTAKETLQQRALELLMEVDPVSKGDLTIRANVTEDEIGTVADSYNATISSLRKIVTQVQTAAAQMATTTSSSEVSSQGLSTEALRQTQEITVALNQIQEMSNSIRAVAANAKQAEAAVQLSTQTVEVGDAAMNRTVKGIGAIRETVAQTSIKVKRLGESSQKISKVVKLISSFADQTNLLALNAAIEAARAGEQGLGFAVVADEVQALALQSAEATAEIESLVMEIQTETTEVVAAMEAGTAQVAEGTRLVDETRLSLNQITAVSNKISALVQAIASATVTQSQASASVTHTMTDVAAIAFSTSTEANQVSASFKELLAVAQELQASAGQFKVT